MLIRGLRLFVSSTFADVTMEWDVLPRGVFWAVEARCFFAALTDKQKD
jgi:hypothetical protein